MTYKSAQDKRDACQRWRVNNPAGSLLKNAKERARLWHSHEALLSEGGGDWYGAVFHLDRLLELDPGSPLLLERRQRAWQEREKSRLTP